MAVLATGPPLPMATVELPADLHTLSLPTSPEGSLIWEAGDCPASSRITGEAARTGCFPGGHADASPQKVRPPRSPSSDTRGRLAGGSGRAGQPPAPGPATFSTGCGRLSPAFTTGRLSPGDTGPARRTEELFQEAPAANKQGRGAESAAQGRGPTPWAGVPLVRSGRRHGRCEQRVSEKKALPSSPVRHVPRVLHYEAFTGALFPRRGALGFSRGCHRSQFLPWSRGSPRRQTFPVPNTLHGRSGRGGEKGTREEESHKARVSSLHTAGPQSPDMAWTESVHLPCPRGPGPAPGGEQREGGGWRPGSPLRPHTALSEASPSKPAGAKPVSREAPAWSPGPAQPPPAPGPPQPPRPSSSGDHITPGLR